MAYSITAKNGARIYQPSWMRNPGSTRKSMNASASTATGDALFSTLTSASDGLAQIVGQIAVERVQATAKQKLSGMADTLDKMA